LHGWKTIAIGIFQNNFPFIQYFFDKSASFFTKAIWNAFWIVLFGVSHTGLANQTVQYYLQRFIPPQLIRGIYIIITGLELTAVMCNWQTNDQYAWKFIIVNEFITRVVSFVTFWGLFITGLGAIARFGILEFVGLKQLSLSVGEIQRTESTPELVTDGLFSLVRHPLYFFAIVAGVLSPQMSLDRVMVGLVIFAYFVFAIPIEERKLVKIFGTSYEKYQTTTPMLFPSPFGLFKTKNNEKSKKDY